MSMCNSSVWEKSLPNPFTAKSLSIHSLISLLMACSKIIESLHYKANIMINHQHEGQAKLVASQCLSRNIKEKLYSGNTRLVINQRIDRWHCKELVDQPDTHFIL